ncbi:hypothetical protein Ndes2437B_g06030 [Nannochloris sp. 'desiccata']
MPTSSLLLQFSRGFATHGLSETGPKTSGLLRFYKHVSVKEAPGKAGYQIMLDNRVLKTPARHPLIVPTKALALAIAAEWEWQIKRIDASTMPLMSLAATAIDQPQHRDLVIETMLQYVPTDPVICRLEPGLIADKQAAVLNPVLQWVKKEIGATLETSDSIFGAQLPENQANKIRKYLQKMDKWELTAAEQLAASCKSVLLALAFVKQQLGLHEAMEATRLEEDHQIAQWGFSRRRA